MKRMLLFVLMFCLIGCGQASPTLSGGKPVSYWLDALKDPDAKLRKKAVAKLGNVGSTHEGVFSALVDALKDGDAPVRREAIVALMKYGPEARDALPLLEEMQRRDPDSQVRTFASQARGKLDDGQ